MSYELIITEKPNSSKKIADALADGRPVKKSENGVPYYLVTKGKRDIVVACAVGHLFTVAEKEKQGWVYPVFDIEWQQSSKVSKGSAFTSKYATVLRKLAKDADEFTVATDYDIEGEVIGLNIVRYLCKKRDANRMKFSTLTKGDLVDAYENKAKHLDWGQANAGETRHFMDWMYGINTSRALAASIKKAGMFKVMSTGRVQGPALKIIVDREKDIKDFKPVPFWQISLNGSVKKGYIEAWHKEDKFWEQKKALNVMKNIKGVKKGKVSRVEKKQFKQRPPVPFDLTTLQTEAYRCFRISPKETLSIGQSLYTSGWVSYPRTSSQKLPKELGFKKLMNALAKQSKYKELVGKVLKGKLEPNEGKKSDPAHPSIYPTGEIPKSLEERPAKIYDLIVKRFLACFGEDALRETMIVEIDVNKELFIAKGTRTVEKGWHVYYSPYVNIEEEELPFVEKGDSVDVKKIAMHDKETQPPKRYTPASIIRELEKKNLGTKATRSEIVDTLFQRGYADGKAIEATKLGIKTVETLEKYSPKILDEELTRHFEEEMEEIREGKKKEVGVLKEVKGILTDIMDGFKKHEKKIGEELVEATRETWIKEGTVGKCPKCKKGVLMIKKGKFGMFIACDKYPDCDATFKLPSGAMIKVTDRVCEECGYPMINVIRKKKRPQMLCINQECSSKKIEDKEKAKEAEEVGAGKLEKECPKCKEGNIVLRKSIYGQFFGCSRYPKCRYTEKLQDGPLKEHFKKPKKKKKSSKK